MRYAFDYASHDQNRVMLIAAFVLVNDLLDGSYLDASNNDQLRTGYNLRIAVKFGRPRIGTSREYGRQKDK